jgi:hypothetical protein
MVVLKNGNVGIGTTSPGWPLHVVSGEANVIYAQGGASSAHGVRGELTSTSGVGVFGEAKATSGTATGVVGHTHSQSGAGVLGFNVSTAASAIGVRGATGSSTGFGGYFEGRGYFSGNVGIGTDNPTKLLSLEAVSNPTLQIKDTSGSDLRIESNASSSRIMTWGTTWLKLGTSSNDSDLVISPSGHVDIAAGLTVQGVVESAIGGMKFPDGTTQMTAAASPWSQSGNGLYYSGGSVGIGTNNPGSDVKLQLAGANANIRIQESEGSPYIELGDSSGQKGYLQWFSSTNRLMLYSSGHAYPVAIGRTDLGGIFVDTETNGSDVGIGTESPQYKLHVAGSAGKPGGGSWTNSSDRRLKKNIHDLDGSLDRLLQLRSVSFEYKNPEAINELPGTRIGMIAQEVEEVFPDWVSDGGHGYKTVTFRGFEALTVEALRELREERDRLLATKDEEIRGLRAGNADLESRVAQLESLVAKLAGSEDGGK